MGKKKSKPSTTNVIAEAAKTAMKPGGASATAVADMDAIFGSLQATRAAAAKEKITSGGGHVLVTKEVHREAKFEDDCAPADGVFRETAGTLTMTDDDFFGKTSDEGKLFGRTYTMEARAAATIVVKEKVSLAEMDEKRRAEKRARRKLERAKKRGEVVAEEDGERVDEGGDDGDAPAAAADGKKYPPGESPLCPFDCNCCF